MLKCSFDFDDTLDRASIEKYAKELIDENIVEVWIVTSRFGDDTKYKKFFSTTINVDLTNNDLFEVAARLGIPKERIHFTDLDDKWKWLKDKNFLWHIDDDWVENRLILKNTKTKAISSLGPSWKAKCIRIIKKALNETNT